MMGFRYGSLAINTHSFKQVEWIKNYTGPGGYRGSAVTVGAGVQVRELYRLANQQNPKVVVVGGECPTVGLAGGYIQVSLILFMSLGRMERKLEWGIWHESRCCERRMKCVTDVVAYREADTDLWLLTTAWVSINLLSHHITQTLPNHANTPTAADHALSFQVITAAGDIVTADNSTNPDLFWALKGGGPSTFGAVVSVTLKTFPEVPTAGVSLSIRSTGDLFWKGVTAFHNLANHYVDNGMFVYYELSSSSLNIQPFVGPNMNKAKIEAVLKPLFDKLRADGVQYTTSTREFPTFFDMYTAMFQDESAGFSGLVGGRLFTKKDIETNGDGIARAFRTATSSAGGGFSVIIGHIVGKSSTVSLRFSSCLLFWTDPFLLSSN